MSVQEIERAITQLPPNELTELMAWLGNHHHQKWDEQIEDDLDVGRLDDLVDQAEAEYELLRRPSRVVDLAVKVYDGLSKQEIDEVERIACGGRSDL